MSKLKKQLLIKKEKRENNPCWKLSYEQKEFIEEVLGFEVTPVIYSIKTKPFKRVKDLNHLLKEIHYSYKRGVFKIAKKLTPKDRNLLDEYGIKYGPFKYEIHLR